MSALGQLNLRPQERRILVVVLLLIFVVLNFWLVTPLFGQLGQAELRLRKSQDTLRKYEGEIDRASTFERLEQKLKQQGGDVLSEELQLQRVVDTQARAANVMVSRYAPGVRTTMGRTNQFFEDQGLTIDFTTGGKELVEFLVGMAFGNSMIHIQDMNLRPVSNGTRLGGNILFVASYQKRVVAPPKVVESGSQPKPVAKAAAPPPSETPKTTAPATTSVGAKPKPAATNAARLTPPAGKTVSTNSAKPPKK